MVFSKRMESLKRFASDKANMILGIIESVFWLTAMILLGMNAGNCSVVGSCATAGLLLVLALVLL